ncbi:MAG: glycosyltransferase [Marinilabiliaceae bacterium]|nr:glycosyltransferase [Marinilabiliaceae bacterium]
MTITIITATYQSSATLQSAIESVLNQTANNIEYIVIDGGSTDGTIELLKKYDNRIKWFSEPDNGIYDALNKGISKATGDYIGFLHADDLLASDTIIEKISTIINETNADAVYGNLVYISKYDTSKVIRYWKSCKFNPSLLKKGWMPPHPTLYIKRKFYDSIGIFNIQLKIAADYDFILRLFSLPGISTFYINDVIVKMRIGGTSNRNIKNIIKKSKEDYWALKHNKVGGIMSLFLKNISKINQFTKKDE